MTDALQAFGLGVVWGFGLSVLSYMIGSVIGHSLALFNVD